MKPENMHAVSLFAHTLSCTDPKVLRIMQSDTFELQGVVLGDDVYIAEAAPGEINKPRMLAAAAF